MSRLRAPTSLVLLVLLALFGLGADCGGGTFDDDDTTSGGDDDDDDDDDDDATPEGIPVSGELRWQPTNGDVPAGAVRVGLWRLVFGDGLTMAGEDYSDQVTKGGLSGGANVFTVYVDAAPGGLDVVAEDTSLGAWVAFAYADSDGDGAFGGADVLLGTSDTWLAFIADEDGELFEDYLEAGAGLGWNTLVMSGLGEDAPPEFAFAATPEGTNSNNGPEIRARLIPNVGGDVPLTSDLELPPGTVVAAWHSSVFSGTPVEGFQLFPQSVDTAGLAGVFAQWAVGGAPPPAAAVP